MKASKEQLLGYISAHPGATGKTLKEHFATDCSSRMAILRKQGRVTRSIAGKTLTGVTYYGYTIANGAPVREREDTLGTVRGGIESLIDTLAQSITEQIITKVKAHLGVEFSRLAPEQYMLPAPPVTTPIAPIVKPQLDNPNRPKVLVVGVRPEHMGQLKEEFRSIYKISFWTENQGDSCDQLKASAKYADAVFVWLDHVGHKITILLEPTGARVIKVRGGINAMHQALLAFDTLTV